MENGKLTEEDKKRISKMMVRAFCRHKNVERILCGVGKSSGYELLVCCDCDAVIAKKI